LLAGGLPVNPMLIFTNVCSTYLGSVLVDPAALSYAAGETGSVSFISIKPPLAIRIELQ
jgi:hypothetical protein